MNSLSASSQELGIEESKIFSAFDGFAEILMNEPITVYQARQWRNWYNDGQYGKQDKQVDFFHYKLAKVQNYVNVIFPIISAFMDKSFNNIPNKLNYEWRVGYYPVIDKTSNNLRRLAIVAAPVLFVTVNAMEKRAVGIYNYEEILSEPFYKDPYKIFCERAREAFIEFWTAAETPLLKAGVGIYDVSDRHP